MTPQELKNSILQRAIQGKLVEQRPEEGTAEELYQQIQAEKQALIKAGKIKKEKPFSTSASFQEYPFDIPDSWKFVRFGELMISRDSERIPVSTSDRAHRDKIYDYYGASGVIDKIDGYLFDKELLLIGEDGANLLSRSTPIAFLASGKYWVNNHAHVLDACSGLYLKYVCYYINAISLAPYVTGTAQPKMNQENMNAIWVALPPLAEQKRIVAKIEELLPLIDRYEAAYTRLEEFNKRFPGDMQKSLLQMAIQGKLVEQRPEEGTGEELFRQIQTEKQALIKAGKIKKDKPLPAITDDEKPFDIPDSWKWVRIPEIGELNRGKSKHRPRNDPSLYTDGKYPFIQTGDVAQANYHISTWKTMYNQKGLEQSRLWPAGTVCMTIAANIGDVAILDFDACFPDSVVGFLSYGGLCSEYFMLFGLMCYKDILDRMSRSTAQKNINLDILASVAFPLPPLAEQKRIVAKLEELLPLCEMSW